MLVTQHVEFLSRSFSTVKNFYYAKCWVVIFVLFLALLFSAVGVCYIKHWDRSMHRELESLQIETHQLQIEWTQLLAEESTWAAPSRIQTRAKLYHDMKIPSSLDIVMVKS